MDDRCRPASPESVTARWIPGQLDIRVKGEFPENCWEVAVHQTEITVWPPEFRVEECRVGDVCNEVITPYDLETSFAMNTPAETVRVHVAGRTLTVEVSVEPDRSTAGAGTSTQDDTFLSLDAAFKAAVKELPAPGHPNEGRQFNARITYQDGGIVGPKINVHLERA